jgi:hypothetical protein
MNEKWQQLPFDTKQKLLQDTPEELLKSTYELSNEEYTRAQGLIEDLPQLLPRKHLEKKSAAPDKRSLREASRDFTMTLTFAELIDNSIDRFLKNKPKPNDVLQISINFNKELNTCIYEDNAGGFLKDDLPNFFKPGGTDNQATTRSIGSYAWGAKKARSALADSVDVVSRAATGPACFATIDDDWDNRDDDWFIRVGEEGSNIQIPSTGKVQRRHTRIYFKNLRPLMNTSPAALAALRRDLGELYGLLLAHHPLCPYQFSLDIRIDGQPVTATYQYRWTQYRNEQADVHPRQYFFESQVELPFVSDEANRTQKVTFILEIGLKCDTGCGTEAIRESNLFNVAEDWGIDVYGLGGARLIARNLRSPLGIKEDLVNKERGMALVKGRLIILGSSHATPWDTHKAKVAVSHPTLSAINSMISPVVQTYLEVAKKAAGRGGVIEKAVSKFSQIPWDGQWERPATEGKSEKFTFDLRSHNPQQGGAASPDEKAIPARDRTGSNLNDGAPSLAPGSSGKAPAPPIAPRPGAIAKAATKTTSPVGRKSVNGKPQLTAAQAPAPTQDSSSHQPTPAAQPSLDGWLPKIHTSRTAKKSARLQWVKFQLTEAEHRAVCTWLNCERTDVNQTLKQKVLKEALGRTTKGQPVGSRTPRSMDHLQEKITDRAVLARLQAAGLTTVAAVRRAGMAGLRRAGFSEADAKQVLAVLE